MHEKVFGESRSATNHARMFSDAKNTITDLMNVMWSIRAKKAGPGDIDMLAHLTEAQDLLNQVRDEIELARKASIRE